MPIELMVGNTVAADPTQTGRVFLIHVYATAFGDSDLRWNRSGPSASSSFFRTCGIAKLETEKSTNSPGAGFQHLQARSFTAPVAD
jgi:hypothetical protein